MASNHALYQVSLKLILKRDDKIFVLITPDEYLDFPGGRIDKDEIDTPFEIILQRETAEELGEKMKFTEPKLIFVGKRAWKESDVLTVFYEAQYIGGNIQTSDEHVDSFWIEPSKIFAGNYKYVSEDERQKLMEYFGGHTN